MPRYKVVNNVRSELTAEEEAEMDAQAEAADLDVGRLRPQRNGYLDRTDRTQIGRLAARSPQDRKRCTPVPL